MQTRPHAFHIPVMGTGFTIDTPLRVARFGISSVMSLADDALVEQICAGLDARKRRIPWEEAGPLPVERMCREAQDTPQLVPLHPAAERFWRARGYLS